MACLELRRLSQCSAYTYGAHDDGSHAPEPGSGVEATAIGPGDAVTCPRCGQLAPLADHVPLEHSKKLALVGGVVEMIGLLLTLTSYTGTGMIVMLAGGVMMLLNLQTPRGTCTNCAAHLAADWRGHWYS